MRQNLWPNALAKLCGAAIKIIYIYIIEVGKSDVLNVLTRPNRCESVGVDLLSDPRAAMQTP